LAQLFKPKGKFTPNNGGILVNKIKILENRMIGMAAKKPSLIAIK